MSFVSRGQAAHGTATVAAKARALARSLLLSAIAAGCTQPTLQTAAVRYDSNLEQPEAPAPAVPRLPAELVLEVSSLDFGDRAVNSLTTRTVSVTNRGEVPARLMPLEGEIRTGDGQFFRNDAVPVEQPCGAELAPGASCRIPIAYLPKVLAPTQRAHGATIRLPYLSGAVYRGAAELRLRGTGAAYAFLGFEGVEQHTLAFVTRTVGAPPVTSRVRLRYAGLERAVRIAAPALAPPFSWAGGNVFPGAGGTCRTDGAAADCEVVVAYQPMSIPGGGEFRHLVEVSYQDPAVRRVAKLVLTGRAQSPATAPAPASLSITPVGSASFGLVLADGTAARVQEFTLTPAHGTARAVQLALAGASVFRLTGSSCGTDISAPCRVSVEFRPSAPGSVTASLRADFDPGAGAPRAAATLAIDGRGAEPATLEFRSAANAALASQTLPTVHAGKSSSVTVRLVNAGANALPAANLSLRLVNSPTPFSHANCAGSSVAGAGAFCSVNLSFRPMSAPTEGFANELEASYDAGDGTRRTVRLGLSAQARGDALLEIAGRDFGRQAVGTRGAAATITISKFGVTDATLVAPALGPDDFRFEGGAFPGGGTCDSSGVIRGTGTSCTFRVHFEPAARGTRDRTYGWDYRGGATDSARASFTLRGVGAVAAQLVAASSASGPAIASFDFGTVDTGRSRTQVFTLRNGNTSGTDEQLLRATQITPVLTGADFTAVTGCNPASTGLDEAQSCTVSVTYAPRTASPGAARLTVAYHDGTRAGAVLVLDLSGTGRDLGLLRIAATGANTSFGRLLPGESREVAYRLSNEGPGTVALQGLSVTAGTAFALVGNDCGASLASGAACTARVRFAAPAWPGAHAARLSVNHDPGDGARRTDVDLAARVVRSPAIAAAGDRSCLIDEIGQLKCWGSNDHGELGLGHTGSIGGRTAELGAALARVPLGTEAGRELTARSVAMGTFHSCAILDNGRLKCWGRNDQGQLGLEHALTLGDQPGEMGDALPYVNLGTGRVAQSIAAGDGYTCAVLNTGELKCWGQNHLGQLGYGDFLSRGHSAGTMGDALASVDFGAGRSVREIGLSPGHACARLDTNEVRCWGDNHYGQLGIGAQGSRGVAPRSLPSVALGVGARARSLGVGGAFNCVALEDGGVKCFGRNEQGALGTCWAINDRNEIGACWDPGFPNPTAAIGVHPSHLGDLLPVVELAGFRAEAVVAGASFACARGRSGAGAERVRCWGSNRRGQLGLGDWSDRGDERDEIAALNDVPLARPVSGLAAGGQHVCALLDDGSVRCWGSNAAGQLGLGDAFDRGVSPGQVAALPPVRTE